MWQIPPPSVGAAASPGAARRPPQGPAPGRPPGAPPLPRAAPGSTSRCDHRPRADRLQGPQGRRSKAVGIRRLPGGWCCLSPPRGGRPSALRLNPRQCHRPRPPRSSPARAGCAPRAGGAAAIPPRPGGCPWGSRLDSRRNRRPGAGSPVRPPKGTPPPAGRGRPPPPRRSSVGAMDRSGRRQRPGRRAG